MVFDMMLWNAIMLKPIFNSKQEGIKRWLKQGKNICEMTSKQLFHKTIKIKIQISRRSKTIFYKHDKALRW